MCYLVLVGGKWLWLLLMLVILDIFDIIMMVVNLWVSVVVELMYIYLLIYDDLLVMDND